MKWTGLNELRESFLSFFESKSHTRLKSYPLVPQGDKSLLLINSGMAPMKKFFLGQEVPPSKRVTTCQKCIRTPDIERVGKTSRHGTYFEMLGNFSFGDYFKVEATKWAWEYITEVIQMPLDRIWVSIYQDDDEAFEIWTKQVGVRAERIVRLGKEDNFWEIGSGPCGPCSEIYYDRGVENGCDNPNCAVGCDCDRFVEFWNLVFSQYNSDGKGNYELMEKPNIDTGMGLERLACITQGVDNLFEVDTVQNIMKHIMKIAKVSYKTDDKIDVSLRVITDHIRSTTFMVSDGVTPSNEGRGYVLRRLLRRAARHGRLLGIKDKFLFEVVDTVINENQSSYPELLAKKGYIKKIIEQEETSFCRTVDKGMELLGQVIDNNLKSNNKTISGQDAFKLSDTFGFPIDLTLEIAEEKGLNIDRDEFDKLMNEQRTRAREARKSAGAISWSEDTLSFLGNSGSEFVGYNQTSVTTKIQAILVDGEISQTAEQGQDVVIVVEKTSFYAVSGGQVAGIGKIYNDGGEVEVIDCQKDDSGNYLHYGVVTSGSFNVSDTVVVEIDNKNRLAIMKNHTTAHLLQASLRNVLGNHVHQAGQLVDANRLRFDFSHFSALTSEELSKIEDEVNDKILQAIPVDLQEMSIEDAQKIGAMALFSEKYGDVVRVCKVADYSIELCGGTHIDNTSKIGLFKIISESSVASGVRRIEATTSIGVLDLLTQNESLLKLSAESLKIADQNEIVNRINSLLVELKQKEKEISSLNEKIADNQIKSLVESATEIGGFKVITSKLKDVKPDVLKAIGDKLKERNSNVVAVICSVTEQKGNMLCVCGEESIKLGANAGKIIKEVSSIAGGKGGGRPDSAMAGISEFDKIDMALAQVSSVIQGLVK
jgi:alanyl-tRNA synthetase